MTRLGFVIAALFLVGPACRAGELRLQAPPGAGPGVAGSLLEVLPWKDGERARPVAHAAPGATLQLADGQYGLRPVGADSRMGPIRIQAGAPALVRLGGLRLSAPPQAAPADWYLLEAESGAVAAKVSSHAPTPALVLPGRYQLARDLSDPSLWSFIEVEPGRIAELTLGALELTAPGDVRDATLLVTRELEPQVAASRRVAALGAWSRGPLALEPGVYQVCRSDSGIFSPVLTVKAGELTTLSCGTLRALHLGEEPFELGAVRVADGVPLLRARSGAQGELVIPGEYRVAHWRALLEAESSGGEAAGAAHVLATPGTETTIWLSRQAVFAAGEGEVPVRLKVPPNGRVVADRPLEVEVAVAERCRVQLLQVTPGQPAATDDPVLTAFDASPPRSTARVRPQARGELLAIEARIEVAGTTLRGRSAPAELLTARIDRAPQLTASARAATWVELSWTPLEHAVSYRVYRDGHTRPLSTRTPSLRDLGLSAARRYSYQVCGVDERGVEGPRARLEVSTEPR